MEKDNYKILSSNIFDELSSNAVNSPRKRKNFNIHEATSEKVQRFFNAVEPDSYVRPHSHLDQSKIETLIIMRGSLSILLFDATGNISDLFTLSNHSGNIIADLKPGVWHSVISNEPGTIYLEVTDGPYLGIQDKAFAEWAPAEDSPEADSFLTALKQRIKEIKHENNNC